MTCSKSDSEWVEVLELECRPAQPSQRCLQGPRRSALKTEVILPSLLIFQKSHPCWILFLHLPYGVLTSESDVEDLFGVSVLVFIPLFIQRISSPELFKENLYCPTRCNKGEGEDSSPFSKGPSSLSSPGITCVSFSSEKPFGGWRGSNLGGLEESGAGGLWAVPWRVGRIRKVEGMAHK